MSRFSYCSVLNTGAHSFYIGKRTPKGLESETTTSDSQHTWAVPLPATLALEGRGTNKVLELNQSVHITKHERNLDLLQVLVCKSPFCQSPRLMNFQVAAPDLNCALYKAPRVCWPQLCWASLLTPETAKGNRKNKSGIKQRERPRHNSTATPEWQDLGESWICHLKHTQWACILMPLSILDIFETERNFPQIYWRQSSSRWAN